ncbi:MAG: hypothetical protein ACOYYF_03360 [Chloroflexota bacterium]|nr:hypothetical protein [Chloroflexota bacterium]MBI5703713.1 hypothetical protein [Chloroflexota bacterium]
MKTKLTLLFLTLILGACSQAVSTPQPLSAHPSTETAPPPSQDTASTQCAYQWAYHELPDLTAQFNGMIQPIIPNSISRATTYGENCVAADGQVIFFSPMETDFYITVTVETLDDYETFGNWLYDVMLIVDGIPPEDLAAPQAGFVEFRFEKSPVENITFRVPMQGYFETAGEKTGEELFRLFYPAP